MATANLPTNLKELQALGQPVPINKSPDKPTNYAANTYDASKSDAASYTADQRQVDQQTETVEGRLAGLLDKGSPLMQRAETKALQHANSRGLLNSSMAVGAAHGAQIDAALPIASQDAGFMNQQRLTNQAAVNQERATNAGYQQQSTLANQQADNQAKQFNAGSQNQMDMATQQQDYKQQLLNQENELTQLLKQQGYHIDIGLKSLEHELALGKLDATVYANMKGQYLDGMMDIVKNSAINISEIQKANNIQQGDKEKMVQQQINMRNTDVQFLQTLYGSMPTWTAGWAVYQKAYS